MRVTRAKQYRRRLRFFKIVYGIAPCYKVLLDGNFIHACCRNKVPIADRIRTVLQGEAFKLYTPRRVISELKALGVAAEEAYEFTRHHCLPIDAHAQGPGTPADQILALIGDDNTSKYLVASQDEGLKVSLRRVPGCPLMFLTKTVLVLEQPSGKSKTEFDKLERKKGTVLNKEERLAVVATQREQKDKSRATPVVSQRLKKRAREPNPLSVKKAKKIGEGKGGSGRKRRRRKGRGGATEGATSGEGGEGG